MRHGLVLACLLLAVAGCGSGSSSVSHPSPSHSSPTPAASPSPSAAASPSPSPVTSPSPLPSPVTVPAWAALSASCTGSPTGNEALLVMQSAASPVLADVTDAKNPKTLCTFSGAPSLQPQLVTQTVVSWFATQGSPGTVGSSLIAVLDLFTGTSTIAASWPGGGFMDGLHAWSPDRGFLAYVTSDSSAVNLHLLSGGGDRVVATLGAVPGRGVSPTEDDYYLAFSPDGAYFALVQTFAGSGDELQVRRTLDGSLAYSLPTGTMASWGSSGSRLYFRRPNSSAIMVWDSTTGLAQAMGRSLAWIQPRADAGDDNLAFTVRDSTGMPHVWLYGHNGGSGGQLPNARSSPAWLNSTTFFYVEEAPCAPNCGIGPAWQPDGKTYTVDLAQQTETASKIASVLGAWPRPGQV